MSDSTQLVPYASLPDIGKDEKFTGQMAGLADRLSAVFINIENKLASDKAPEQTTTYEKLANGLKRLNEVVVQPAAKLGNSFLATLAGMEKDAQSAQSLNVSVDKYQAIKYASEQSGGDQNAVEGSIKNVTALWQNDKDGEILLNNMGVATREDDGTKRDNGDVFLQLAESLGGMNKNDASLHAGLLGIDENTLNAMHRGLAQYVDDYQNLLQATDLNAKKSAGQSSQFMISWRQMSSVVDLFSKKLSGDLAEGLSNPITSLTEKLLSKAPQIENVLNKAGVAVIWFGEVFADALSGIIDLVTDVAGWWDTLDSESQTLIAALAGLVGAWLVLNSAFMASPIGIILSLVAAIGLLYNDYQKWKSGSDSLIDWGKWEPVITLASQTIGGLANIVKNLFSSFMELLGIDFSSWSISTLFQGLLDNFNGLGETLQKIGKLLGALKDGNWSEVANIGKDLITGGLTNTPAGWIAQKGANYIENKATQAWSGFVDWATNGEKKTTRREEGNTSALLPKVMDNLASPDTSALLPEGYGSDNQRYAWSSDLTQPASGNVSSPTWNNKTDIAIYNARDPYAVGEEVERRQLNVYARQTQQYSGGLS
ncbi:hypothetical protein MUA02_05815 [Enterobacteriaceae bacterium H20N1]|uniref:Uncharacterized protein n=1 Tax=Dryocola boscaweniae TaxID=2925397 RepID=A0A9X2W6M1_9ENTR|nr:hypothetical protein [Dryocola boscaweniae]MCT4701522.1 hypothetical protein [Dryocola boscaweniae]MCT4718567.1 hypothetical protein [Dryocola boscaweniae]